MADLLHLPPPQGTWFASVEVIHVGFGRYALHLTDMPKASVEELRGEPADKLTQLAAIMREAAASFEQQAEMFRG